MDWNDLRYFLAVARTSSLTLASTNLRVSQSTVSRRVIELEESLGMTLFQRHQTGYFLTDEGREVFRQAELVEDSIMALQRSAAGLDSKPTGTVRLATSESLATDLVIPALAPFRGLYPDICLEIITSTATAELDRREADIALRVVRPARGNLKVRRVGHMAYSVYGSRDYLERHPYVEGEPLGGRHFIAWDDSHAHLPAAEWLAREHPGCKIALVTSSLPAQIAAVRAGLGLAVVPDFLTLKDDFIRVIPNDQMFNASVWLVTHADLAGSARVRAVADFLSEQVMRSNPELSGRWMGA
ncbi:LysR family transcriptional regulator [Bradyrhizobium sp. MOS003]|jgi:DNA-binding transcriptional LysR family regulator|uniref:LysR family transcriptional regulator n=1 Tax=Bradyrhizobium sp. MOS003 TaxID=2133946 RepID=UPI000D12FE31|nr:LysR family transcriptional regulator [Bradyrhizobium sp. MOS003]PSO15711.1 LysR family transcriptional regulator [Bradyrhizobium sp. MOS003]